MPDTPAPATTDAHTVAVTRAVTADGPTTIPAAYELLPIGWRNLIDAGLPIDPLQEPLTFTQADDGTLHHPSCLGCSGPVTIVTVRPLEDTHWQQHLCVTCSNRLTGRILHDSYVTDAAQILSLEQPHRSLTVTDPAPSALYQAARLLNELSGGWHDQLGARRGRIASTVTGTLAAHRATARMLEADAF